MHGLPGLYAQGLLSLFRGECTVESQAAAVRLASCLLLLEHAHTAKQ